MATKIKHSKFKNTGILFELLTRQITADILSGKRDSKAKELLFKYFNESKELGKEWQLYNFLVNEQLKDDIKADRTISIVIKEREKLSNKKLAEEKYNLIREIKEVYPIDDFLKSSIKNYKTYASIYKVFENRQDSVYNIKEVVDARNFLVETLISKKSEKPQTTDELLEIYKNQNKDVKMLAYKFLVDGVNEKYKDLLPQQKIILREYINNISNTNKLKDFIVLEMNKIKTELSSIIGKVDSKVTGIKLNEVVNQIQNMNTNKGIKDNHIVVILMAHDLLNEIKKRIDK